MKKFFQILLNIYLFLFIFTMVNREFKPFGVDIRFIVFPLGIIILAYNLINNKFKVKLDKNDKTGNNYLKFYIIVLLCNVCWLFNGLKLNQIRFINEIILIMNTFVGLLVIYFNKKNINFNYIINLMVFSCIILSISIFLSYIGVPFEKMMGDVNEPNIYYGNADVHQKNIFGDDYRCAGYASDANYATMLLLFGIISTLKLKTKQSFFKILLVVFFLFMMGLSFSKTILISSIFVLLFLIVFKNVPINKKNRKIVNIIFLTVLFFAILLIPFLKEFMPRTMTLRFIMWDSAKKLFLRSPLFGNGITSFRSYFALSQHNWYVPSHSTFWQILSEVGLIGMYFYLRTLFYALNRRKNKLSYFLTVVFIIWSATYETIALPLSLFPIYFLELENNMNINDVTED